VFCIPSRTRDVASAASLLNRYDMVRYRGYMTKIISQTKTILRRRHHVLFYLLLAVMNMIIFSWTSPLESPAIVVIGGFVLASVDLFVVILLLVRFLCRLLPSLRRFQRRITVSLVSFGVITLALASLGQLTWHDLIVVIVIWVLGYMYSLRFRLSTSKPS